MLTSLRHARFALLDACYEVWPLFYLGGCVTFLPVLTAPARGSALIFFPVALLFLAVAVTMLACGPFDDPAVAALVARAEAEAAAVAGE